MDVQCFTGPGTWRKPAGAEVVYVVLVGATSSDGTRGETAVGTYAAGDLPDSIEVSGPAEDSARNGMAVLVAR